MIVAVLGALWGLREAVPEFRARNVVEQAVRWLLIAAASIAVLTTLGIVLSLVFNTIEFFRLYPAVDFFFGTNWAPSFSGRGGSSDLGVIPLLWGTFYISIVALAVAIPIGLFAAVYLSEYASHGVRSVAKPLLEILAGIPTIVYGLFALLTVGPLAGFGLWHATDLGIMQAGTAVVDCRSGHGHHADPLCQFTVGRHHQRRATGPARRILRSGCHQVRDDQTGRAARRFAGHRRGHPAGRIRAIGETMIVVLGAGAAARLSLNPFDAMTTVTAKIVSQLTGDADFASPEALVAFALGMTLFVITLALNIFALYIVRKYREQYD